MGGGNAQKSAMARERNAAAAAAQGRGGGGNDGKEKRGGDTAAKIAAGQAEKAEREAKKVALAEKKKLQNKFHAKIIVPTEKTHSEKKFRRAGQPRNMQVVEAPIDRRRQAILDTVTSHRTDK